MDRWTELAMVAHEVGGALAPARNAIQLLEADPPSLDARHQRLLDVVARGLSRAERVLEHLNSVAIPERHEPHVTDCNPEQWLETWLEAAQALASERGLRLQLEVAPNSTNFPVDGFLFEQVISCLLSNAMKFTPTGGSVTVRFAPASGVVLPGRVAMLADGFGFRPRFLQVRVEDTGIGLGPETRRRLFEPFYRGPEAAPRPGAGLGLAVARRFVALMHGDLRPEPRNTGACFVLTLPANRQTLDLAAAIDASYAPLSVDLAERRCGIAVLRAPGPVAERLCRQFDNGSRATRVRQLTATTCVAWSGAGVRALVDDLRACIGALPPDDRRAVFVHVRQVAPGSVADEIVLQGLVRCRRALPESLFRHQSAQEKVHGTDPRGR